MLSLPYDHNTTRSILFVNWRVEGFHHGFDINSENNNYT